jgi:hypothetical protein
MRTLGFTPRSLYIYDVATSLEFCFGQEKDKSQQKILLKA